MKYVFIRIIYKRYGHKYYKAFNADYISFKIYKFQGANQEVNNVTSFGDIASLGNHPLCNSKKLNKIVDVTIGYPDGKAIDFFDIMLGRRKGCTVNVHYRIFDLHDISAKGTNHFKDWMYNLYYEKDKLLEELYITGKFINEVYGFQTHYGDIIWAVMG